MLFRSTFRAKSSGPCSVNFSKRSLILLEVSLNFSWFQSIVLNCSQFESILVSFSQSSSRSYKTETQEFLTNRKVGRNNNQHICVPEPLKDICWRQVFCLLGACLCTLKNPTARNGKHIERGGTIDTDREKGRWIQREREADGKKKEERETTAE